MKLKSEGGVVRPASRSCGKDLTLITAYRQQGIAPAATARHMICFASIRSFTGGSCGMSYERWGDLWNTEFLKMNRIALSVGLNRSSVKALLLSRRGRK